MNNMKQAEVIDYDDALSAAIGKLRKNRTSVVVMKKGRYYGVLDDREIWSRYLGNMKAGTLAVKAPVLNADSLGFEVIKYFTTGKFKSLPVMDGNVVRGIITRADMMRELANEDVLGRARVKDVMSTPVTTIESKDTVARARAKMRRSRITHLVVTEKGRAVGTFSTYDVVMSTSKPRERLPFVREKLPVDSQSIGSYFRRFDGIGKDERLSECARTMADHDISELVVVEDGTPLGIVVANDIFKLFTHAAEPVVEISGLVGEDRQYAGDILEQARMSLSKLSRGFDVERLTMHVKRHGRRYSVHTKLIGRGMTAVSSYAWNLYDAVKQSLDEVKKVLTKGKRSDKGRKRIVRGSPD